MQGVRRLGVAPGKWLCFVLVLLAVAVALVVAWPTRVQARGVSGASAALASPRPAAPRPVLITLESFPNPSVFGEPITITATVEAGTQSVSGTVTFTVDSIVVSVQSLGPAAPLVAIEVIADLSVGNHSVHVDYSDDTSTFRTGSVDLVNGQTVNPADTQTTVSTSSPSSVFGEQVTFTAVVSAVSPGSGTPLGDVQFQDNGADLGSPVPLSTGSASLDWSSLTVGSHLISAVYLGDSNFTGSSGGLASGQSVGPAGTQTTLATSANPAKYGQTVYFTASVAATRGSAVPDGIVQFWEGGNNLGSASLAGGQAYYSTSALSVGTHALSAAYMGDGNFSTSTGDLSPSQVVEPADTTTALAASPNPATLGQTVHVTATVTTDAPGSGIPDGSVQFRLDGGNVGSPLTLAGGTADLTLLSLTVGAHAVTAAYSSSRNFNASTGTLAPNFVVNKVPTTTSIGSHLPHPSLVGQAVTIQFSVAGPPPWIPTGSVTVTDGASSCTAPVSTGSCVLVFSTPGTKTLTATYGGDGNLASSTSRAVIHLVSAPPTTHRLFLPSILKPVLGPRPGAWQSQTNDEFNVRAGRDSIEGFAIYIDIPDCGMSHYKITHTATEPILNNHVAFSGPFYADITFDSETTAHGWDGLNRFTVPGCGTNSAGPWSFTAVWKSSSPLALPTTRSPSTPNLIQALFSSVPRGHVVQPR